MLNRPARNIRFYSLRETCSWLVQKYYFVLFTASRFPYMMLYRSLMTVQRKVVPLTQGIRTISIKTFELEVALLLVYHKKRCEIKEKEKQYLRQIIHMRDIFR